VTLTSQGALLRVYHGMFANPKALHVIYYQGIPEREWVFLPSDRARYVVPLCCGLVVVVVVAAGAAVLAILVAAVALAVFYCGCVAIVTRQCLRHCPRPLLPARRLRSNWADVDVHAGGYYALVWDCSVETPMQPVRLPVHCVRCTRYWRRHHVALVSRQVHVLVFSSASGRHGDSDTMQLRVAAVPAVAPAHLVLAALRDVCDAMGQRQTPMTLCAATTAPVGLLVGVPIRIRVGLVVRVAPCLVHVDVAVVSTGLACPASSPTVLAACRCCASRSPILCFGRERSRFE
jgi:hypothetical protein